MLFLLSSFLLLYSFLNCQEEGSNQERMLLVILSMPNLLTEFVSMPMNSIFLLIPSLLLYYQPLHLCSTSFPLSPIKVHPLLSPSCIIYFTTYWIILISLKTRNSFQLKKKNLLTAYSPLGMTSYLCFSFLKAFPIVFSFLHCLPS